MSAETDPLLLTHADRTSSFQALHPSFRNFVTQDGEASVRYVERGKAWIGATEPFSHPNRRIASVREFFISARQGGKRASLLPVSEELSQACVLAIPQCERIQVGSEPIFDLNEKFQKDHDPLLELHRARALKRRGASIEHHAGAHSLCETTRETLNTLAESWHEGLRTHSLGFLNQMDLWDRAESKHFFILRHEGRLGGFLTAVPLAGKPGAYYFADVIRASGSKAGTIELLMIEAMRILHQHHSAREVRLGLCPLSLIQKDPLAEESWRLRLSQSFLHFLGQRNTPIYGFRSAFEFKSKLGPSRWEPLFLLSAEPIGIPTAIDIQAAHFDTQKKRNLLSPWLEGSFRKNFREPFRNFLNPIARNRVPTDFDEALQRTQVTFMSATLLLGLHLWKSFTPSGASAYAATGYQVNDLSVQGWFWGPLFHNHHYHFFGDFISFLFFGTLLEWISRRRDFAVIAAFGLWATNPLSHGLILAVSRWMPESGYQHFLSEVDYGSSNAIYAFVGALAFQVKRPLLLLAPFIANGVYLCVAKESWLSLHHLVALAGGWILARWLIRFSDHKAFSA